MHIGLSMMIGNPEQFHRIFGAKKMISLPPSSPTTSLDLGFSHILMEMKNLGEGRG
jgi:hypothetical protein